MSEILGMIPDFIEAFALIGMCVSILATVVVRLTPSKVDDEKVGAMVVKFQKALSYLPTIGINPRTQLLEQQLKEIQEKLKAKENG
jgi:ATP adenylyltransferase/5',5'''-P-1,P-4-tetraphosphate phosphorylase II